MKTSTKLLLLASMILGFSTAVKATAIVRINDISMNATVSGNGFGLQYTPTLGLRLGQRSVVYGGPTFCNTDWKNTGMQLGMKYQFVKEEESYTTHFRLSAFGNVAYFKSACLSHSSIAREMMTAETMHNEGVDFSMLKYGGMEYTAGITFSYVTKCGLFLRTEVGAGWYTSEQKGAAMPVQTYRDNKGATLRLGAGIGWAFAE